LKYFAVKELQLSPLCAFELNIKNYKYLSLSNYGQKFYSSLLGSFKLFKHRY